MKFKILPGTDLFQKLWALNVRIEAVRKELKIYVEGLGYKDFATDEHHSLVRLDGIQCPEGKPDGWVRKGDKYSDLYMPAAKKKGMWLTINSLPRVSNEELNSLVNFGFTVGPNLSVHYRPGIAFHKEFIIMSFGDGLNYKPVEGMIEIIETEFNYLSKEIEKEEKRKQKV